MSTATAPSPANREGTAHGAIASTVVFIVAALAWAAIWYAGLRPSTNVSIPREFGALLALGAVAVGLVPAAALGAIAGGVAQRRDSAVAGIAAGVLAALLGVGLWWVWAGLGRTAAAAPVFPWRVFALLALSAACGGGFAGTRAGSAAGGPGRATAGLIARASESAMHAIDVAERGTARWRDGQAVRRVAEAGLGRGTLLFLVAVALAVFSFALQLAVPEFHVAGDSEFALAVVLRAAAQPWTWLAFLVFAGSYSTAVTLVWAAVGAIGLGINAAIAGAIVAAVVEARRSG